MSRMSTQSLSIGIGVILAAGLLSAPPALAAPSDTAQAALEATLAKAEDSGLDVISTTRSTRTHTLPASTITVPARTALRHHVELDTQLNHYYSIRTRSSGDLLGMRGIDGGDVFSTLSWRGIGISPDWPQTFARSRGFPLNTVIRDVTERMGYYDDETDQTLNAAKRLIAPPTSWDGVDDFWRNVRARRASGGRTIISASSTAGETDCTYPSITLTIKNGVIVQSAWTAQCPDSGTTTYRTKVAYEDDVASVPAGAISENAAFATPVPGQDPGWQVLAAAANKTASTSFRTITEVNSANVTQDPPSPSRAVRYLDAVMMAGNPGVIVVPAIARTDDPGWRQYVVSPSGTATFLAPEFSRNITGLTVDIGGDGVIDKMVVRFSTAPTETTITFTP